MIVKNAEQKLFLQANSAYVIFYMYLSSSKLSPNLI